MMGASAASGILLGLIVTTLASATEMPGYEEMNRTAGKSSRIIEVQVVSTHATTEVNGPNVLYLKAKHVDTMKGVKPFEELVHGKYEEFHARDYSDRGLHISYRNYTGSGIEFRTKANDRVILFLAEEGGDGLNKIVLRIEPSIRRAEVQRALEAMKGKR